MNKQVSNAHNVRKPARRRCFEAHNETKECTTHRPPPQPHRVRRVPSGGGGMVDIRLNFQFRKGEDELVEFPQHRQGPSQGVTGIDVRFVGQSNSFGSEETVGTW